jgi:hypothetical protein
MKKALSFLYPFLFALYPILELRNYNVAYVDSASLFRPILLSLLLTGLVWLVLWSIFRDQNKTGIITTLIIISFFSYGQIFLQIQSTFGDTIRHRYLMLIFIAIIVLIGNWIFAKVKSPDSIVNFLMATGGILFLFSVIRAVQLDVAAYQTEQSSSESQSSVIEKVNDSSSIQKPDIYFILLDAHTRSDILKEDFNYDNSAFIQQLKDLGFYVAECAQSNYPATKLSVTATFYGKYHDAPTLYPVNTSLTIQTVRSLGYKVITFENRSNGHFDLQEDVRLSRNQLALGRIDLTGGLSEFEMMLLKTSALRIFYDMPQLVPGLDVQMLQRAEFYEHYQQTKFILSELKNLPDMARPKFVFAHILVPHPPFIFAPDGKFHWADQPRQGYVSNVEFIDSQIALSVAEIIKKSKIPPVIIIMGDHGPTGVPGTPHMRMSILNAYYVNDQAKKDLYETISPINSFRVVFNNYFGTKYPLLEDKSYFAYDMHGFNPDALVPNTCQIPSN